MSFHYALKFKKPVCVLTYTENEYEIATSIRSEMGLLQRTTIVDKDDATKLSKIPNNYFDQVLVIEVLERISNDREAVRQLYRVTNCGGRVVVSAPTPCYPYYFGVEFDRSIGHLRHYTPKTLRMLFESEGFNLVKFLPHTYSLTASLCKICYQKIKNKILKLLLLPCMLILSFITEKIKGSVYCRFLMVFEKQCNKL